MEVNQLARQIHNNLIGLTSNRFLLRVFPHRLFPYLGKALAIQKTSSTCILSIHHKHCMLQLQNVGFKSQKCTSHWIWDLNEQKTTLNTELQIHTINHIHNYYSTKHSVILNIIKISNYINRKYQRADIWKEVLQFCFRRLCLPFLCISAGYGYFEPTILYP